MNPEDRLSTLLSDRARAVPDAGPSITDVRRRVVRVRRRRAATPLLAAATVVAVVAAGFVVREVSGADPSPTTAARPTSTPTATPSDRRTGESPRPSAASNSSGYQLSLLGVCDHLDSVLATGGQGPRAAFELVWDELQLVANVSDRQARRALQPVIDSAREAAESRDPTQPKWQAAQNRTFADLDRKCRAVGSTTRG